MNPNYFYDIKYISPLGAQMYEYSRLSNHVDFAAFYHDSMWEQGLLDDSSRKLIEQYNQVPRHEVFKSPLGLEFDCGSRLPALFARLHPQQPEFNQEVFTALANIVGLTNTALPELPKSIIIEDAGVFPERATGLLRLLLRGPLPIIRQFADANDCINTDIIGQATDPLPMTTAGISFDWDGNNMTNFMFHSATIHTDNPWVLEAIEHANKHISELFANKKYNINRYVKVGLSPNIPVDYMKTYFTVRYSGSQC
jgi:hypothetical protein